MKSISVATIILAVLIISSATAVQAQEQNSLDNIIDKFNNAIFKIKGFFANLKLGQWFAPTNELKVDSAGIHFYSGWSDPSTLTWHLEDSNRAEISNIPVTTIGYYNFPLPTTSGDYHLYCTGASGCDAGDWFRISLSTVPASPADTIISGWCSDGRGNFNTCSKASKYFPYSGGYGTPTDSMNGCNTCTGTRDINTVPGYDTSAKIVSAPPMPTPTPVPTAKISQTPPMTAAPTPTTTSTQTTTNATEEIEQTCPQKTYFDEYSGVCKPISQNNSLLYGIGAIFVVIVAYFYFGGKS